MMDNRKWYKKFATIFWWIFTTLPIIVALIQFIGFHLTFNSGIASATELAQYHNESNGDFITILNNYLNNFDNLTIPGLKDTFTNMFNILGITSNTTFGVLFGYMLSVQLYHLLYDMLVFFIHLIHEYVDTEKWCR